MTRGANDRAVLEFTSAVQLATEYRYHESLVHPGLAMMRARRVLVLGGGDGLAVREILKYPHVEEVTLVDLDPEMPRLFTTHPQLAALNGNAFRDPRVHVVSADAMAWLERPTRSSTRGASADVNFRSVSLHLAVLQSARRRLSETGASPASTSALAASSLCVVEPSRRPVAGDAYHGCAVFGDGGL